jgi:hypothetical protein
VFKGRGSDHPIRHVEEGHCPGRQPKRLPEVQAWAWSVPKGCWCRAEIHS